MVEPGVSVSQLLRDMQRLAGHLLLPAGGALVLINLPGSVFGHFFVARVPWERFAIGVLFYLVTMLAEGAILYASHQLLLGDARVDSGEAWRTAAQRWGAMAGAALLSLLASVPLFLLLFVPGVLQVLAYFVTTPIALHERLPLGKVLKESRMRTQGRRASIFGAWTLVLLVAYLPAFALRVALRSDVGTLPPSPDSRDAASALIAVIQSVALQAPVALLHFLTASVYVRCSVRHGSAPSAPPVPLSPV